MADLEIASISKLLLPFLMKDIDREGKRFTFDMEVTPIGSLAQE